MGKRRTYDDDDGRTIADMSGVSRPNAFVYRRADDARPKKRERMEREGDPSPYTSEERRMYVFAALKASLLIAAVFIVGLGAAILAMILLWS